MQVFDHILPANRVNESARGLEILLICSQRREPFWDDGLDEFIFAESPNQEDSRVAREYDGNNRKKSLMIVNRS